MHLGTVGKYMNHSIAVIQDTHSNNILHVVVIRKVKSNANVPIINKTTPSCDNSLM